MKHFNASLISRAKGALGEWLFCRHLAHRLSSDEYRIFHNVYLPFEDGGTTQVDCIVVSRFGVFVLEVKSFRGWIFGNAHDKRWTQTFFRRHATFMNPLHQNYAHTQTIIDLIDVPADDVHSVVAFHGSAKFKTEMPDNVMHFADVPEFIRSFDAPRLSANKMKLVCLLIEGWNDSVSFLSRLMHVRNLNRRHGRKCNG